MTNEREVVRGLARSVAEIAAGEENARIIRRWRDVNALRRPDRAPVWCRPVDAWKELLPADRLVCADPWLRGVETYLRQILIKHEIGDDTPVDGCFPVGAVWDCEPRNVWGVEIRRHRPDSAGGSWRFDPPLKTEADFDRLRKPSWRYNGRRTEEAAGRAHALLGDILPVRVECHPPLDGQICSWVAELRGLSQMMLDMADAPELMHRLMGYLRDAALAAADAAEASGRLTRNGTGPMFESDPFGPDPGSGPLSCRNLWMALNSQEFDQVSPAMWKEFLLDYQLPIIARYGLCAYGCCENLTRKMDDVFAIPNLRIFVCSAWTDLGKAIDRAGDRVTIMWRQKATDVVFPDDVAAIRRHLDEGMARLRGCRYQVVLRELQTLAGHPDRLHVWARLAKEAAERHA